VAGGPLADADPCSSDEEGGRRATAADKANGLAAFLQSTAAVEEDARQALSHSDDSDDDEQLAGDDEAYVPGRHVLPTRTAAVAMGGAASRPLDIPFRSSPAGMALARRSLPKGGMAAITAHVQATQASHAHPMHSQRNSIPTAQSSASSQQSLLLGGATSFLSADSSASSAAASSSSFYSGVILAPSSLNMRDGGHMQAVPLPLTGLSKRANSPFMADGADAAVSSSAYNNAARRTSVPAVPLLQAQLAARAANSGASSSNTSPHGSNRAGNFNSPPLIVPAAASSYTYSAAAKFLPHSGAHAMVTSNSYGSFQMPSASAHGGNGSSSGGNDRASLSPLSPLPPRPHFGSPSNGLPLRARTASPMHAYVEEVVSYDAVAACPPHEQAYHSAASSRRPSITIGLRQPLPTHGVGSKQMPLRCAGAGEIDVDIADGFGFDTTLGSHAPTASPSPDAPGFEMDLEFE
jgi:hypothetical protein